LNYEIHSITTSPIPVNLSKLLMHMPKRTGCSPALMDHPGIARVLDAGATATGRPYFVMEPVRGIRITDYCKQNQFDTRQRLALSVRVCHAIQSPFIP